MSGRNTAILYRSLAVDLGLSGLGPVQRLLCKLANATIYYRPRPDKPWVYQRPSRSHIKWRSGNRGCRGKLAQYHTENLACNLPLVALVGGGLPVMVLLLRAHGIPLLGLRAVAPSVVEVCAGVLDQLAGCESPWAQTKTIEMALHLHTSTRK
jgi:hypothetical protein